MDLLEQTTAAFAFLASEFPDETPALSRLVGSVQRVVRGGSSPSPARASTIPKGGDLACDGRLGLGRVAPLDPPASSDAPTERRGSTLPSARRYDLESEAAWDRAVAVVLKRR